MARPCILAAAAAFAALSFAVPASAQAPKAPVQPTKAQIESASFYFSVLISAMQAKEVEVPVKNALFTCIFENGMGKIADAVDKTIAANVGKVDKTNPTQVLGVMAGVCGYKAAAKVGATPAPTPAPTPAKPGQKPTR